MTGRRRESGPARRVAREVARVLERGGVAALVTVIESPHGQAPAGAKLLIEEDGARTGTTGSPRLDEAAAAFAPLFLDTRAEARTYRAEELARAREEWRGARLLFERIEPAPHVVVCGAGHVGAALARLAAAIGYRATLIDDRAEFVEPGRFSGENVSAVAAENWSEAVRRAVGVGRGVSVAVVTRGHAEDEECLRAALLARPDYVGMIGSRRRTNIVLARLRAEGFADERLREVRAPIGLDIGAVSPEEVALASLAEIVARRRGGTGRPLSAWRREEGSHRGGEREGGGRQG